MELEHRVIGTPDPWSTNTVFQERKLEVCPTERRSGFDTVGQSCLPHLDAVLALF
ncbi:hypothetical protein [Egbenema bharatensis]|uniref:hypothetical protein n=1 Tax=Egbenema bharatensis TaxID=3463334 RepID=UPI003A844AA4